MTAVVTSSIRIALVSGSGVTINAPVVPNFTTDDIYNADNLSQTLTEQLALKQAKIGSGAVTASDTDLNALAGTASYGLVTADLNKLADVNASATEINRLVGVTSAVQTQLNSLSTGKVTGAGVDLTGLTVTAEQLNSFFEDEITTSAAEINLIDGLTADAADLNALTDTATHLVAADLIKLGDITASAAEINVLDGFTGDVTDLNAIAGLTATADDINTLAGLAGQSVSATELAHLSGLTENVQDFIDAQPDISGLTASASDLNLLAGAAAGTGAFSSNSLSSTELSYLNGVTSAIQTQLNGKASSSHTHGIAEISGASITITELNRLNGVTSSVQTQLNTLTSDKLALSGGTMTGALAIADGTAGAPSLKFSNSTTTGLYRASANTIGVAVAGAAFGSIAASAVQWGIGTTGAPTLTTASMSVSAPTYTFIGDTDTGMYRVGANSLGFSANATNYLTIDGGANTITIGGATATNTVVAMSGIFRGVRMVASAVIDCSSVGNTTIYTIPTGRKLLITAIYLVATTITGTGTAPAVNFGMTGTYDEIVDAVANPNLFTSPVAINTTGQVLPLGVGANAFPAISGGSGADYQYLSAAQVLTARVITATTGYSAFSMTAYVFGMEF